MVYGIILDLKDKMITVDEVKLSMQNINYLQGSSTLCTLKLNSLAMEPHSTQDAIKHVTWIVDPKYKKADLKSIVRDNCKHLSADQQKKLQLHLLKKYELLFDGILGDWKTKLVLFQLREEYHPTMAKLSQCQKPIKTPSSKRWRDCANWGY
jgi:hypothetical protein